MQRKSRSRKTKEAPPAIFKSEWLSYQEIMARYRLTLPTVQLLSSRLLFDWQPQVSGGLARYLVTADNDFMLRLGCLSPYSFPTFRPPFLRFLLLRFFSRTDEQIVEEMQLRRISLGRLDLDGVRKIRALITLRLPEEAQPLINGGSAETPEQKALLSAMLFTANIEAGYTRPADLDTFYFASEDSAHRLSQVSATGAPPEEAMPAANILYGRTVFSTPTPFTVFRLFFADFRFMTDPRSLPWYLNGLAPKLRRQYQIAMTLGLRDFMVNIDAEPEMKNSMIVLGRTAVRHAIAHMQSGTEAGISLGTKLISTAIRVMDATGEIQPVKSLRGDKADDLPVVPMTPKKLATYEYADRFGVPPSEAGGEAIAK